MEIVKELLNWLWPNAPWIIPSVAVAVLSWRLSRWTKDMSDTKDKVGKLPCEERRQSIFESNADLKRLSEFISKLPCENHKSEIASNKSELDRHFAESDSNILSHTRRLEAIESKLERWDDKMMELALSGANSARKSSPYRLTPFGEFILVKSMGKDCIDRNLEHYFAQMDEQPHTTPFDIERSALGIVIDSFRTDITNSVKNFIYNSPSSIEFDGEEIQVSTTDIQVGMAIYLRDLYMRREVDNGQITPAKRELDEEIK